MNLVKDQKTALVMGGSRGIGRAIVRHSDAAKSVADEIRENGGKTLALHMEAGSPGSIQEAVQERLHQWDHNNAAATLVVDQEVAYRHALVRRRFV
jgi:NAD(P)-dependent dehydrogenase (short-subunit alcohol dehydrogenase family)